MDGPRLQITPGMRAFLDYPKFSGPTRMLVLETSYFFEGSWRRAAETLGWKSETVPSAMVGSVTREDVRKLFTTLGEFKPDFILASNYAGMDTQGMFSRFLEDARIPYVSWFTDTPRMILYDRKVHASHYSVAATWERAYTKHFQDLGFEHIFYMPLATDPTIFNGAPMQTCPRGLAFVGNSMTELANEAWQKLEHLPEIIHAIRQAFADGLATPDRFAQGIPAIIPHGLLKACSPSELRHIELCLIYEATRRQRAEMALRLDPYGLEVRGDPDWRYLVRNAGGTVAYHNDLAAYYRTTAINLNSTSIQMRTAVNQRVFDCPAAGGFLITDDQADLADLFDLDSEIVTNATLEELENKVGYYLKHPEHRIPMIQRAQQRIISHHTHAHRLQALETYLRRRYA